MGKEFNQVKRRLGFLLLSFVCFIFFLIYRIGYIKLVKGEEYEKKAIGQQLILDQKIPAMRGGIYDRNQHGLVIDHIVYNVILDTVALAQFENQEEQKQKTADFLHRSFDIPMEELQGYMNATTPRYYIVLKKNISQQLGEQVQEEIKELEIKGVWLEEATLRNYLYNSLAAHVIGFTGAGEGRWGVELQYNDILTGLSGRKFRTFEQGNYVMKNYVQPTHGNSLILTIDETIQRYVEDALLEAIYEHEPQHASAIAMDPSTGEILGMASFPTFNPNEPANMEHLLSANQVASMAEDEKIKRLNQIWQNFNITYTYEPGSTFKPMVIAAALEENIISSSDTFYCEGFRMMGGHRIRCWKRNGHGLQTLEEVLANSCNVAMMDIGAKLGKEKFYQYQRGFGFGSVTGIDLPGEQDALGLIHKEENLGPVELATSSFGQTFNATPIQVATAFAAAINGGDLVKPHVVKQIIDAYGNIVQDQNVTVRKKVISEKTSKEIRESLEAVVAEGTGRAAQIPGYRIGGKTGTAEQGSRSNPEEHRYILSFVGFVPVENPKIMIYIALDRPKDTLVGSTMVTTPFKKMLEQILPYLGISPTQIAEDVDRADFVLKDYTDMYLLDVAQELTTANLQYEVVGSGSMVINQIPKAGTKIEAGSLVYLYVTPRETDEVVEIPNIIGKTHEEALSILSQHSLRLVFAGEGNIVDIQEPKAGTRVDSHSEVYVQLKK
ncbi:MAG: PASTA domain-containing protein [Epulopiscium sp.]|nr:PASTA domain-containing protein [Candidatus Epulonipiscium sp.]